MDEIRPKHVEKKDVEIWFQDEARVGQKGTTTRIWTRKGSRPRLMRQQQYEYAYIFGAVCPSRDCGVGLVLPSIGKECMQLHLEEISAAAAPKKHAILVLDRAAWHTTKKLNIPKNISLLELPPTSPELNPTEQVWQCLRDRYLANRTFLDYEDILIACCEAWNKFVSRSGAIKKLCTREWATAI